MAEGRGSSGRAEEVKTRLSEHTGCSFRVLAHALYWVDDEQAAMRLIDQFHQHGDHNADSDFYIFVFDEVHASGEYTMLVLPPDAIDRPPVPFTVGPYEPAGDNEHLGQRLTLQQLGEQVLDAFFWRLSIPAGWEDIYQQYEQYRQDGDA